MIVGSVHSDPNCVSLWVLRRRRNCSYALICTSFDFLVYGALIHRDCFIIYLLSVFFFLLSTSAVKCPGKKREKKNYQCHRSIDRSIHRCVYIDISIAGIAWNVRKKKDFFSRRCVLLFVCSPGSSFFFGHFTFKIISRHLSARGHQPPKKIRRKTHTRNTNKQEKQRLRQQPTEKSTPSSCWI